MSTERQRLAYVDGLRGIAVLSVVAVHSDGYDIETLHRSIDRGTMSPFHAAVALMASQGYEGVTLFLVLSGFCLAYPVFVRHERGLIGWFDLRRFAVRRCWRILPPYYAALAVSLGVVALIGPHPSTADILAHVALIQNMTPYRDAINGPFWSLGLEWQWYFLFPVILYAMLRRPRATLALTFALACAWHLITHDWGLWLHGISTVLPARLFEFTCGVAVARLAAVGWKPPRRGLSLLAWVVFLPLFVGAIPPARGVLDIVVGPAQPFFGISFAAILLLAIHSRRVQATLSWRPLVLVGLISYSVYLMHKPWIDLVQPSVWHHTHNWIVATLAGYLMALASGSAFFWLVERHFVRELPLHKARRSESMAPAPAGQ